MSTNDEEIKILAYKLKLKYLSENYYNFFEQFASNTQSAIDVVKKLFTLEVDDRQSRNLESRFRKSKIGRYKPMDDFDWQWPKSIDDKLIKRLLKLEFIESNENIILLGPQGVGKSMIAKNLAHSAISRGKSALVTSASELVTDLAAAQTLGNYRQRIRKYLSPQLLVIDEIGYLSFDQKASDLLFEIVSKRYEVSSIVLTTNLPFQDWSQIFPGANSIIALIDRLTHHSHIVTIDADSFRLKESKIAQFHTQSKKDKKHGKST